MGVALRVEQEDNALRGSSPTERVFLVGRIRDARDAVRVLRDGGADMVAMTRAQIADPFLVTKIRAGREDEVIQCIGANECLLRNFKQFDVACIMKPRRDAKRSGDMESWIPSRPRVHAGSLS